MIPARSDRGLPPPTLFKQDEDEISYALSSQNRYDEKVHQSLHGKAKESIIYGEIEIETLVSTFKLPDLFTKESLELKKAIVNRTKKDVFRTSLIQSYIAEDWENFASKYAWAEFIFQLSFVVLIMT